jgi:hypothetical protein
MLCLENDRYSTVRCTTVLHFDMAKRLERSYSMDEKLAILDWLSDSSKREIANETGIPYDTIRYWEKTESKIRGFKGSKLSKTTGGQGRKEIVPFSPALVVYMKDIRRDEKVLYCEYILVLRMGSQLKSMVFE